MNVRTETTPVQGLLPLLMSMIATRLELAAIDVEELAQTTVVAFMTSFVAVVLGLVAFAFAGVAVIVIFWETHRIAAAIGVTLCCAMLTAFVAWLARTRWISRPAAFAGTLHEFKLDGEAFRRRS